MRGTFVAGACKCGDVAISFVREELFVNTRAVRRAKKAVEEGKVVSQTYDEFLNMSKNLEVAESKPRYGK